MNVKRDRFGLEGEKTVPVLNVRIDPDDKERLVDMQAIFPAYHMNKKHWISIFLDGRTDSEIIKKLLDDSYSLALKKPKKTIKIANILQNQRQTPPFNFTI